MEEVKLFAINLASELDWLVTNYKEQITRQNWKKLAPACTKMVSRLKNSSKINLTISHHNIYGNQLQLVAGSGPYFVPAYFINSINWRDQIKKYKEWILTLENQYISWEGFQNEFISLLLERDLKKVSFASQTLEKLRFMLSIRNKYPTWGIDENLPSNEYTTKIFAPIYTDLENYTIKDFYDKYIKNSYHFEKFLTSIVIPNPFLWNLEILLLIQDDFDEIPKDRIYSASLINFIKDQQKKPLFALYWVPRNFIHQQHQLRKRIAKKVHFWLNFNQFKQISNSWYIDVQSLPEHALNSGNISEYIEDSLIYSDSGYDTSFLPNWNLIIEDHKDKNMENFKQLQTSKLINQFNNRFENMNLWTALIQDRDHKNFDLYNQLFLYRIKFKLEMSQEFTRILFILSTTTRRRIWAKLIPMLKTWLFSAVLFEFSRNLLFLTYIPKNLVTEDFLLSTTEYFQNLQVTCLYYIDGEDIEIGNFLYQFLPESKFYDEKRNIWNLPKISIHNEVDNYLKNLLTNEKEKMGE